MSFALKGALRGIAEGIESKIDKEREDTRTALANRTKNAYTNYLTYQEKLTSLKEEIKKRDQEYVSIQPDLTEQERVALATMPNAMEIYKKAVQSGTAVSLRDIITVPDMDKNLSFDQFVKNYGKVASASVGFKQPESMFAPSVEKQQQYLQRMTEGTGVPTDELMAFERMPDMPYVKPMGSFKPEALKERQTVPQQIDMLMSKIADGRMNNQDVTADEAKLDALLKVKGQLDFKQLDPDQKRERRKVELMNTVESNTSTAQEKKAAKDELLRMANTEKMYAVASSVRDTTVDKPASMAQFKNVVSMAAANAAKTVSGPGAKLVNINPDPYSAPIYTIDGSPDAKNAFKKEFERLVGITLTTGGYVDNNGRLRDNDYAAILSATGINVAVKEDGGRYFAPEVKSVAQKAREDGSSIPKIVAALKRNFSEAELLEEGFHPEEINEAKLLIQQQSGGGVSTNQSPSFSSRSLEDKNKIDAAKKKGYIPIGRSGNQIIFEDAKGTRAFESDIL